MGCVFQEEAQRRQSRITFFHLFFEIHLFLVLEDQLLQECVDCSGDNMDWPLDREPSFGSASSPLLCELWRQHKWQVCRYGFIIIIYVQTREGKNKSNKRVVEWELWDRGRVVEQYIMLK